MKGEIAIKIYGPDLEILTEKSEQIANILKGIRGSSDVAAIRISGQSELDISIDREKIARLGINVADVNAAIQTALAGVQVNTFYEGDKRFDVTVRLKESYRNAVDDIALVQVSLPGGAGTVGLGELAHVAVRQGASRISREAGVRNASVKANLLGRDQGSFVREAQKKVREQVVLPPGYTLTWGGQFENMERAMKRLMVIIPLTIAAIFFLLFLLFDSARYATLVITVLPLAAIVTAFTVAHSLTLAATTLGVLHVPAPPLEAAIALSILFLAPEIVRTWRGQRDRKSTRLNSSHRT